MTDPTTPSPSPPPRQPQPQPRSRSLLWSIGAIAAVGIVYLLVRNNSAELGFDSDDAPRFIILFAILAFVGVGIVTRGIRAGEVVRSLAVWTLIILVLVGLYATRDQLAGVAGRILGAIAPGMPISGRLAGETNPEAVAIVRSSDGHFAVRAVVEGKPVPFLLDTGASFVTLTSEVAARVGIDTNALRFVVPIHTANGPTTAASITIRSMTIGSIERKNVAALVAPPGALDMSLLGMTFLNTLGGFAVSGDRLVLSP